NIIVESRSAEDEGLRAVAAELVQLKVDLIVAGGYLAIQAAKQATSTIPIVMAAVGDPVGAGLVASLARPGGNVTGISLLFIGMCAKRVELFKEAVPGISRIGVFRDPALPDKIADFQETQSAARAFGMEARALEVRRAEDLP